MHGVTMKFKNPVARNRAPCIRNHSRTAIFTSSLLRKLRPPKRCFSSPNKTFDGPEIAGQKTSATFYFQLVALWNSIVGLRITCHDESCVSAFGTTLLNVTRFPVWGRRNGCSWKNFWNRAKMRRMPTVQRDYYEKYWYLSGINEVPINGIKTSDLFIEHLS